MQRVRSPSNLAARLIVIAPVDGAVLALGDAVVVLDEAHVEAAVHHGHLSDLVIVPHLFVLAREVQVVFFVHRVAFVPFVARRVH